MNSIYAITTQHERRDDAAEAWHENNVCAIGWRGVDGPLDKAPEEELDADSRSFLKIRKGDLILAYFCGNTIAYVGEIKDGKYLYTDKNTVGQDEEDAGFGYRNQFRVKWYDAPYYFSRKEIPPFLSDQLGIQGRTVNTSSSCIVKRMVRMSQHG